MREVFKAIAFDLDGTLIDTEPFYRRLTAEALKQKLNYDLTDAEYDKYFLGLTTTQGLTDIFRIVQLREPTAAEIEDVIDTVREVAARIKSSYTFPLFPRVLELLERCRELKIPVAIVTNSRQATIDRYADQYQWSILTPKADQIVTRLDKEAPKPHPALYLRAAEQLGVDPADLLAVEDSEHGVKSAKLAGAKVVRVNGQTSGEADYYFKTIGEMIEHLPEFFAQE